MTVRLTEALNELETDGDRGFALGVIAGLLGAFPADHRVREHAVGCPKLLARMAEVQAVSEEDAMKAVLKACFEPQSDGFGGRYAESDKRRISIDEVADRIRMVVRPPKADRQAAIGARVVARMAMVDARPRRPARGGRF